MPYQTFLSENLEVESEHTRTTLRVFCGENRERIFTCEITTATPERARITNATGTLNRTLYRTLELWLIEQGYTSYTFERYGRGERLYDLVKS